MKNADLYIDAAYNVPPRILGFQLRPFSSHHALALMMFDSPYLRGEEPDDAAFWLALMVCADGWDDWFKTLVRFQNSRLFRWRLWLRGTFRRLGRDADRFAQYLALYMDHPEYWQDDSQGKESNIPWPYKTASTIWQNYHCTEAEAWDMPLQRAACYTANIAENNGARLMSDDERHGIELLEQEKKESAA